MDELDMVNPMDEFYKNPTKRFYSLSSTESDSSDDPPDEELEKIGKEPIEFSYENTDEFPENWYYSQFWYDEPTIKLITNKIREISKSYKKKEVQIGCVCCPTIHRNLTGTLKKGKVFLFDVDEAKCQQFDNYVPYDFNRPKEMGDDYKGKFDILVADTPHFTYMCIRKIIITIQYLKKSDCKIMFCTTTEQEPLVKHVEELLELKKTDWVIGHAGGLQNPYACFTNLKDEFLEVKKVETPKT